MQNQQSHNCKHCGDPARIINKIQKHYWPFEIIRIDAFCYECYMEVKKGQMPKVTDSNFSSKRGRGLKNRRRLMEE